MTTSSPIPGIKVLLIGGPGSGKTYALRTLISAGVTPLCLFTENSFDVLGDVPKDKLHWQYINPTGGGLKTLREAAVRASTMGADQIQKVQDMTRSTHNQFLPILDALANFKCSRTGESFGNISTWGTDKCLVIDSLSGLTIAATKLAVGEKYALTQPEFQIIMKTVENFLVEICTNSHCHVVVTAHAERELDEVNGGVKIYPSTIGRKLAPMLGRYFTDVIMAKRTGTKYLWDTADSQADLKSRNCIVSSDLPPDYTPLLKSWGARGGIISSAVPT